MRGALGVACLALVLSCVYSAEDNKGWSWGGDSPNVQESSGPSAEEYEAAESAYPQQLDVVNATTIDNVVDEILVSSRQGRNIDGLDDIYKDPNVKQALDSGDDVQARNVIKERLCRLGLMQCEGESIDPKRASYVAPEDVFYAQPVDIKPVGQPIPSIPVRGPPRAYGPPKPPSLGGIPPRKVGYSGPPRPPGYGPPSKYGPPIPGPIGSESFSGSSFNSFSSSGPTYLSKPPGPTYLSKPPGPIYDGGIIESEIPYEFERPIKPGYIKEVKVGSASTLTGEIAPVQQHVHHHYHHGDDKTKQPTVIVNNPLGTETHHHSSSLSSGFQGSSGFGGVNSGGFNPVNSGFGSSGGVYGNVKPVYENTGPGYSGGVYKGSSQTAGVYNLGYASGASYSPSSAASNSLGSYSTTNQFYKKELNTSPVNNNQLGSGSYYSTNQYGSQFGYNGQESGRAENYDCVCVPYDQCPSQDIIGKRDDLFLPIDPRNLPKDIEALPDDKVVVTDGNGTMTVVRIPKSTNATISGNEDTPKKISKRETNDKASDSANKANISPRQAFYQPQQQCGPRQVCCKRPYRPQQVQIANRGQCGARHSQGINGRIKNPVYVDGDSEFGEYPWQAAILKKDPKESVYVCGGTLIDHLHIVTAAHCVKTYTGFDLRVRLGEWDVNHDVEFYPYIERDVISVHVHPQYYAGTLDNDLAILKLDHPVDWTKYPHISPACLPDKFTDYTGARCWTTGWGKDAFGDFGKYQNILKEVDVPVIGHHQCEAQLRNTRLGYQYQLNPGFICAGGEEGKDACKGDGGGPMVCERGGTWQLVGVVSWGIGCGQVNVPGVYVKVAHYLDWIAQITGRF